MKTQSGYLYKRGKNGNWYLRVVIDGNPVVKSLGTTSKREAEKLRKELMHPLAVENRMDALRNIQGALTATGDELAELQKSATPIKGAFWIYHKSPRRRDSGPGTLDKYESIYRRFEKWMTEKHPAAVALETVTEAIVDQYAEDLKAAKFTASSFNQHKNFLKLLWKTLLPKAANPWQGIAPQELDSLASRKETPTQAQYENLLAVTENDPDLHGLLIILANTGLRLIDAVLLKWGAVDFRNGVLTVAPRKTARRKGKVVFIPLLPDAAQVLNARQAGTVLDPAGYVFSEFAETYQRDRSAIPKRIAKAFERAGMATKSEQAGRQRKLVLFGAHSLRHFFVTRATQAGIPVDTVRRWVGHSSVAMTDHYTHDSLQHAAALSARICGTGPQALALLPSQAPGGADTAQSDRGALMAALDALDAGNLAAARDLIQEVVRKLDK